MERIISAMNVSCRKAKKLLGHWGVLFLLIPPSHSVPESVTATVYYYYQRYQRIAGIPQQTVCCWIYILKITEYHTLACIFHYYNVVILLSKSSQHVPILSHHPVHKCTFMRNLHTRFSQLQRRGRTLGSCCGYLRTKEKKQIA